MARESRESVLSARLDAAAAAAAAAAADDDDDEKAAVFFLFKCHFSLAERFLGNLEVNGK